MSETIEDKLIADEWHIICIDGIVKTAKDGKAYISMEHVLLGKGRDRIFYDRERNEVMLKYTMPEDKAIPTPNQ